MVSVNVLIKDTKQKSENGNYNGGYYGPERPLHYYKIPLKKSYTILPDCKSFSSYQTLFWLVSLNEY